jgi:hypothetical protein
MSERDKVSVLIRNADFYSTRNPVLSRHLREAADEIRRLRSLVPTDAAWAHLRSMKEEMGRLREEAELECIKLVCGLCALERFIERFQYSSNAWWRHTKDRGDDCPAGSIHELRRRRAEKKGTRSPEELFIEHAHDGAEEGGE